MPGLPAGVKFDPTDQEILQHLEGKVQSDACKLHPLIDEFIPAIEGENGICYTHPEKLPGELQGPKLPTNPYIYVMYVSAHIFVIKVYDLKHMHVVCLPMQKY